MTSALDSLLGRSSSPAGMGTTAWPSPSSIAPAGGQSTVGLHCHCTAFTHAPHHLHQGRPTKRVGHSQAARPASEKALRGGLARRGRLTCWRLPSAEASRRVRALPGPSHETPCEGGWEGTPCARLKRRASPRMTFDWTCATWRATDPRGGTASASLSHGGMGPWYLTRHAIVPESQSQAVYLWCLSIAMRSAFPRGAERAPVAQRVHAQEALLGAEGGADVEHRHSLLRGPIRLRRQAHALQRHGHCNGPHAAP